MIQKLHYITQDLGDGQSVEALTEQACKAGVKWVQLRMKGKGDQEVLKVGEKVKQICRSHSATFIVNDHVAIAKELDADGVHLGKTDMDTKMARAMLGDDKIVGRTANTIEDIRAVVTDRVDYIGLGPLRFTTTKEKLSPVLGLAGYKKIINACHSHRINIPILAIGGIKLDDVAPLRQIGLHGVALASLINKAGNKETVVATIQECLGDE